MPVKPAFWAYGLRRWCWRTCGVDRRRADGLGGRRVEFAELDLFPPRTRACLPRAPADVAELRGTDAGHMITAAVQFDHLVACGTPCPSPSPREVEHLALAAVGPAGVRLANSAGGDTQPAAAACTGGADGAIVINCMFRVRPGPQEPAASWFGAIDPPYGGELCSLLSVGAGEGGGHTTLKYLFADWLVAASRGK